MHRGMEDMLAELPAYVYNMWVYKATKLTAANRHALHHLDIPFRCLVPPRQCENPMAQHHAPDSANGRLVRALT